MAKVDILDILMSKQITPIEFNFDSIWMPPMQYYLSNQDIDELRKIATSIKLSSKLDEKYKMINTIMERRGFKKLTSGTNRVVYRFLEDQRFVAKIALDKVGMQDNPLEYKNQFLLKPFVTKMFHVSPCGTVGFAERVLPITSAIEFAAISDDIFDVLVRKILGKYVVEDVGTKFFMNWAIRKGFGPCLLDYPYVFELDGSKLYCNAKDPLTEIPCNGIIDYDDGFNHLYCKKCGTKYFAHDLKSNINKNVIVIERSTKPMKVSIVKGDKVLYSPIAESSIIQETKTIRNEIFKEEEVNPISVVVVKGNTILSDSNNRVKVDISSENENPMRVYIVKRRNPPRTRFEKEKRITIGSDENSLICTEETKADENSEEHHLPNICDLCYSNIENKLEFNTGDDETSSEFSIPEYKKEDTEVEDTLMKPYYMDHDEEALKNDSRFVPYKNDLKSNFITDENISVEEAAKRVLDRIQSEISNEDDEDESSDEDLSNTDNEAESGVESDNVEPDNSSGTEY